MVDLALTEETVIERGNATNRDLARKSGELGADFLEDLDEEHEAEEELEEDLDEERGADEDETSACAPYL